MLATGGTIAGAAEGRRTAGYTSGPVGDRAMLTAVPEAENLAHLLGEQIANIGSQDMDDAIWLKLAHRINELGASPNIDGIVITHGTDTFEETAYLPEPRREDVRSPWSCRPDAAVDGGVADGPLNLYNAIGGRGRPVREDVA